MSDLFLQSALVPGPDLVVGSNYREEIDLWARAPAVPGPDLVSYPASRPNNDLTPSVVHDIILEDSVLLTDSATAENGLIHLELNESSWAGLLLSLFNVPTANSAATDALTTNNTFGLSVADSASCSDAVSLAVDYSWLLSDASGNSDSVTAETATAGVLYDLTPSDGVSATDSAATALDVYRLYSDTSGSSDTLGYAAEYGRSDTVSGADTTSNTVDYFRVISDSQTSSDSVALTIERASTDSISVTDIAANAIEFLRLLSDSQISADSTAITQERASSDTVSVTDTVGNSSDFLRSFGDSQTTSDSVALTVERASEDAATATDALTNASDYLRTLTDTPSGTDSVAITEERVADDSISSSDSSTNTSDYYRLSTDSASQTDSVALTIERASTDSTAHSETTNTYTDYSRTNSDTVSGTDSSALTIERSGSDALTCTDQVAIYADVLVALSDAINGTDSIAVTAERAGLDTGTATEDYTLNGEYSRTLSESTATQDSSTVNLDYSKSGSDTLSVSDNGVTESAFERLPADTTASSDGVFNAVNYALTLEDATDIAEAYSLETGGEFSDSVDVTDYGSTQQDFYRSTTESLSSSDAVYPSREMVITLSDSTTVTDALGYSSDIGLGDSLASLDFAYPSADRSTSTFDSVLETDANEVTAEYLRSISNSVAVTDTFFDELVYSRSLPESSLVSDSAHLSLDFSVSLQDSSTSSDSPLVGFERLATLSDGLSVADAHSLEVAFGRILDDSVGTTDSIPASTVDLQLSDSLANVESLQVLLEVGRTSADNVNVSDNAQTDVTFGKILQDSAVLSDIAARTFEPWAQDTQALLDSVSREIQLDRSDILSGSDSSAIEIGRSAVDNLVIADNLAKDTELTRVDALTCSDQESISANKTRDYSDTVSPVDTIAISLERLASLTDSCATSDSLAQERTLGRTTEDLLYHLASLSLDAEVMFRDVLGASDTTAIARECDRAMAETATVSDGLLKDVAIGLLDNTSIATNFASTLFFNRFAEDLSNLSDGVSTSNSALVSLSDAQLTTDLIDAGYEKVGEGSDNVVVADAVTRVTDNERVLIDPVVIQESINNQFQAVRLFSDVAFATERTIVEVLSEPDEYIGERITVDYYMPVGNTGITFVARVPGIQTASTHDRGVNRKIRRLAERRAASTLARWEIRSGGVIQFLRESLGIDQQNLAAQLGVSEATVDTWEKDEVEMPRLAFDYLATLVCIADQRAYDHNFELRPPDYKTRLYRIYPDIPQDPDPVVIADASMTRGYRRVFR